MYIAYCLSVGVEHFAIASSTVNRFWKFFNFRKQKFICNINVIFFAAFKHFAVLPCFYTALLLLDDKVINSTFFKFFKHLKKPVTFLTYLLPCLAALVSVTSTTLRNCWTFGTAFNRVQLSAVGGERVSAPAYGPKEDILSWQNAKCKW